MFDKISKLSSKFLKRTCICYSALLLAMSIIGWCYQTDESFKFITYEQSFTFFAFSLCFAASFLVADFVVNNVILKRTCQFVLTMFSVFVVFINGSLFNKYVDKNAVQNPAFSMLAIMFYAIMIYAACALLYMLSKFLFGLLKAKMSDGEDYQKVFEKKK